MHQTSENSVQANFLEHLTSEVSRVPNRRSCENASLRRGQRRRVPRRDLGVHPGPLALLVRQHPLQGLADGALGQRIAELDRFGGLVGGEALLAEGNDLSP